MAKSRNRSRDIRKRAAKKRANKIRLQKKMDEAYLETNRMMDGKPRFDITHCSQCGGEFGPGDSGYSHCVDHTER